EERAPRLALARLPHDRGVDARDIFGDAEALLFQHGAMLCHGAVFRVADLRHPPDAIGERLIGVFAGIHELPDCFGVLHVGAPQRRCTRRTMTNTGHIRQASLASGGLGREGPWPLRARLWTIMRHGRPNWRPFTT